MTGISSIRTGADCVVAIACLMVCTVCCVVGFLGAGVVVKNLDDGLATLVVPGLLGAAVMVALGRMKNDFSSPVHPVPVFGLNVHTPLLTVAAGL